MHVVFAVGEAELDVELRLSEPDATVADLIEALAVGPVDPYLGLLVDGTFVPPDAAVTAAGLHHGARLELGAGPAPAQRVEAVVEVHVVAGTLAGTRVPLPAGDHVVGRVEGGAVRLDADTVSARHAVLHVAPDGSPTIDDLGSLNGTRVAGEFVLGPTPVPAGTVVQLGAQQLVIVPAPGDGDRARVGRPAHSGTTTFNRPPREAPIAAPAPVSVPAPPPAPTPGARFGWAALLAPLVMGIGMAVLWSPIMAVFCLFSPVMILGNWLEDRRRVRRERREGQGTLARDVEHLRQALADTAALEVERRWAEQPDAAEVVRRAVAPSARLWERRRDHGDFGRMALGVGTVPWQPPLIDNGPRPEAAAAVLDEAATLERVPVAVDLSPGRCLGVVGERGAVIGLLRNLVCQAAVHHGPADLRVAVLTEPARVDDWDWAKWLPHTRGAADAAGRRLIAADDAAVEEVLSPLLTRPARSDGRVDLGILGDRSGSGPATLVVVDADGLTEGRNAPARAVLAGTGAPVAGIVVASSADRLPSVCTTVVELDGDGTGSCAEPARGTALGDVLFAAMPADVARDCARALAAFEDPELTAEGGDLPGEVSLLPMLDLARPTADGVRARWRDAGRSPRLAAPVGLTEQGPLVLDLVADGPHALIAGTTGAGKSELLRSLVASLAASVDPEHLNFVLIDYKGGSAFDACARLPHTVGLVTDLDEHLGERALRCLEAELRHRERRLREVGASELREYLARGGAEPLPRLVVVIDEFATMAAELPDFVDSLVDIAQRGRSLGVHLVLATQRPSGAVSESIRANTNVRVALRVQDVHDSTDVIGAPMAAGIGRRQAGRGYVRLGPGEVFPFQAALVTGRTDESASARIEVLPFNCTTPVEAAPTSPTPAGDETSDLTRLVEAVRDAASEAGFRPPRLPWPEPLPERLTLDEIDGVEEAGAGGRWSAPMGLVDEPAQQRRRSFVWDAARGNLLLYGVTGSGTTTALATLAVSLARTHRPDELHLYALDFGTQALSPLGQLPHVGAVVGTADRERQERLLRQLRDELERRRRLVARHGASTVTELRGDDGEELPAIVLLLDNYAAFAAAFDDVPGIEVVDTLTRVIADGPGLGIHVVATADRPNAIPTSVATLVPEKLIFRLADQYDYANFGIPTKSLPRMHPGRAIDAATVREVQVALPGPSGLREAVEAVVAVAAAVAPGSGSTAVDGVPPHRRPRPVGVLPDEVKLSEVIDAARLDGAEWFVPLALTDRDLGPAGLHLGDGDHALVAGPSRSGKSTTLAAVAAVVAHHRPDVGITAVAVRRSPLRESLDVDRLVSTADELPAAVNAILGAGAPQLVLVDDADAVDDADGALAHLFAERRPDVHVVAAGRADALRATFGHWTQETRRSRQGIALKPHVDVDGDLWGAMLPRRGPTRFDAGRGYLVVEGQAELVQAAMP